MYNNYIVVDFIELLKGKARIFDWSNFRKPPTLGP